MHARLGKRNDKKWPSQFHLSADDFRLIRNIVTILAPVQNVTKKLSSSQSWIGDVLPLIALTIEQVREMEVKPDAKQPQLSLLEALTDRMRMLLNIETELPPNGIYRLQNTAPSEFSIAANLNPKFLMAMSKCFGYSDKAIVTELNRIYEAHFGSKSTNANSRRKLPMETFSTPNRGQKLKHGLYDTQKLGWEALLSLNLYEHYSRKNFRSTKLSLSLVVFTTWILAYFG